MSLVSIEKAANLIGVKPPTLFRHIHKGEIKYTLVKVTNGRGRKAYYVDTEEVMAWYESGVSIRASAGEYEFRPLRRLIRNRYGGQFAFSQEAGYSYEHTNCLLRGTATFTVLSIELFCRLLDIPKDKIGYYFFTKKGEEYETNN